MKICVDHLCKCYGTRKVLADVCFELPEGARLAVWGCNGAGKTTLLRILAGLERPTSGSVLVDDFDVVRNRHDVHRFIGYVGHQSMLYPDLTAYENLLLYAQLYGVSDEASRIDTLLRLVGLASRKMDMVDAFSQGMMQRLALARALIHFPTLLLLDEPYAGLDVASSAILDAILRDNLAGLSDETSYVMISHDEKEVSQFCTHVLTLGNPGHRACFYDVRNQESAQIQQLLTSSGRA